MFDLISFYKNHTPEEVNKIRETGYQVTQEIMSLHDGREYCVEGELLHDFFMINHNPEKGETAKSELIKWLSFLHTVRNITWIEDQNRMYYFKKYQKEINIGPHNGHNEYR